MAALRLPIQSQGIKTRDNVSVDISAVAYFCVFDAINQIAQTTLRKVVGQHTLDEALSDTNVIKLVDLVDKGGFFHRLWSRLVMERRVESDLVGPIAGLALTESAAQRIEDCQALSHQAGGDLAEPVGAVEDCQVCP